MTVPTIFDSCRPRADILAGAVTEADFAADLAQVVVGKGMDDYVDPARFFANTYPTRGLGNLLANVCGRLSGAGGEAASIFRLDTSYGGGKSHGLIALCHAARSGADVPGIAEFVDPALIPRAARIAAFDGENADPANGRRMDGGISPIPRGARSLPHWPEGTGTNEYARATRAGPLRAPRRCASCSGANRRSSCWTSCRSTSARSADSGMPATS